MQTRAGCGVLRRIQFSRQAAFGILTSKIDTRINAANNAVQIGVYAATSDLESSHLIVANMCLYN